MREAAGFFIPVGELDFLLREDDEALELDVARMLGQIFLGENQLAAGFLPGENARGAEHDDRRADLVLPENQLGLQELKL